MVDRTSRIRRILANLIPAAHAEPSPPESLILDDDVIDDAIDEEIFDEPEMFLSQHVIARANFASERQIESEEIGYTRETGEHAIPIPKPSVEMIRACGGKFNT